MNKKLILVSILIIFVAGCATGPSQDPVGMESGPGKDGALLSADVEQLLASAARSSQPRATELTIRAAAVALSNNNKEQAESILDTVYTEDPKLVREYLFLKARIAVADGEPALALRILEDKRILATVLTDSDQVQLGRIRAMAYHKGRSYLASAKERIFFHDLLDPEDQAENHELIFDALMELPVSTLANQAESAITSDLRGWLSLTAMTKQYQNDPLQQLVALNRWKKLWSRHPAAERLPASLRLLSQVVTEEPKIIALLLPLQGDLGPFGRAIRDGFLASHYAFNKDAEIRVYDTAPEEITSVLARAKREGAEIAIGPLDRANVAILAAQPRLPIPVLALNRTLDGSAHADLYQFGLAPEDEVEQVAEQVYTEGKRNALVLYSVGDWGTRNFDSFAARFTALGGNIIEARQYGDQRDYSDLIKGMLNVDESELRATELRRITGQKFEFIPRRRQDVDFVFMLANPEQARQLKPTIAFYYAEDIPVYATSHVYEPGESRIAAIDLNGIRFCDIPWKLSEAGGVQAQVQNIWPAAKFGLAPFYALGVDAYRLYP
ncbi:MAG: penicillin-binding protein activator, partial [Pseudomonadales bacterium]